MELDSIILPAGNLGRLLIGQVSNGGGSWGKIKSSLNLFAQQSLQHKNTALLNTLVRVLGYCKSAIEVKTYMLQPLYLPSGLWSDICLCTTEVDAIDITVVVEKLYTLKISGILVL